MLTKDLSEFIARGGDGYKLAGLTGSGMNPIGAGQHLETFILPPNVLTTITINAADSPCMLSHVTGAGFIYKSIIIDGEEVCNGDVQSNTQTSYDSLYYKNIINLILTGLVFESSIVIKAIPVSTTTAASLNLSWVNVKER